MNENSGAALAVLTFVYVGGTLWIALTSKRSMTEQAATRLAQERPRVVAFVENDSERGAAILVIKNVGRSSAFNLSVSVDPPLLNPVHEDLSFDDSKYLVREGAAIIVPEYSFRSLVGTYGNWSEAPDPAPVVRLQYSSDMGGEPFDEEYPIDLSPFFDMPESRPKGLHSVAEEMRGVRIAVENLSPS